jgi:hypothetical protein
MFISESRCKGTTFLGLRKRFRKNCVRTQRIFDSCQLIGENAHFFLFFCKKRVCFREFAYICSRMELRPLKYVVAAGLIAVSSIAAQTTQTVQGRIGSRYQAGEAKVIAHADGFTLKQAHDSLYWLNDWKLPYPVYQFQTGDVDGDGRADAMVGVVKATRFYPEKARRLFIFKLVNGKARPLWLGSKLGGILEDFRYTDGRIRALESTKDRRYVVSDYQWGGFGMKFERFIIKGTDKKTAIKTFSQ